MCLEDIKLGRKIIVTPHKITLSGGVQDILDYDQHRIFVYFPLPNTGDVFFDNDNPGDGFGGFLVRQPSPGLLLKIQDVGNLVIRQWRVLSSTAGVGYRYYEGHLSTHE